MKVRIALNELFRSKARLANLRRVSGSSTDLLFAA